MKITQEVRDFAAKQNQSADSFLAASTPTVRPEPVEGLSFLSPEEQGRASTTLDLIRGRTEAEDAEALAKAETDMAEMSKKVPKDR